ncbi:MAG: SDR family oxidoreductase [Gammaproteobacteria bacterium]|nr:SDR family oxidoreductase [Gammaproteobacteria bacterium]
MANVAVTGSTKGIGLGYAREFVKRGHNVFVLGRHPQDVDRVIEELNAMGPGRANGCVCDVASKEQVQAVWDRAMEAYGSVDIWINNAGRATGRYKVHELPASDLLTMAQGNFIGTTYGSQVALNGMRQQGHGAIYNTLGGAFDGKRLVPNMGFYSSTKAGINLLTKYMVEENKDQNIIIGRISPGMLITDNWLEEQKLESEKQWQSLRPMLNILCDDVETVTPWLVDQILANKQSGKRIAWITTGRIMKRFIAARFGKKRDILSKYGI